MLALLPQAVQTPDNKKYPVAQVSEAVAEQVKLLALVQAVQATGEAVDT